MGTLNQSPSTSAPPFAIILDGVAAMGLSIDNGSRAEFLGKDREL